MPNYAQELMAVQLFREGELSYGDLGQTLGLDSWETGALLQRHRVTEHQLTSEDIDADVRRLDEILGPVP